VAAAQQALPGPAVTGTVGVGGSRVIKTTGGQCLGDTRVGFPDYPLTTDSVGRFAVFSNSNGNEAAVPFESWIGESPALPFDNTNGPGMGVALANSHFAAIALPERLSTSAQPLPAFFAEAPEAVRNRRGAKS